MTTWLCNSYGHVAYPLIINAIKFFGYFERKQKTLKFTWQHFGTQNLFWLKINLDPTIRWRGLDKINVHIVYNL
jgi:hypothetical protein